MAALLLNPTLSKSKFLNWIKAALAVLFTKEEIEPVVYNKIQQFQQKCLQDIVNANSLQAGSTCSNCCTENVVVCPTDRICNVNRGKCKYHRNATRKYRPSGCPNLICHHLKSEIQAAHRYNGPSYRNTDATQWCSNPWEIAKCFMPPDGYDNVHSASETDFNGIISIIINHKDFDATITDDLSKRGNIFDKGRDVGKAVRHSPNLEVDDADLTQYFADLNNMLNDAGFISLNKTSHNGCQKLAKLQSGDLVIGKDIVTIVLDDAAKAIQERIRNETDKFKIETEKQKLSLIDTVDNKIKGIEEQGNMSVTKLNEALKSAVDTFEKMVLESSKKIEQQLRDGKQTLEVAAVKGVKDINEARQEAIQEIKEEKENKAGISIQTEEENYQKLKNHLKDDLIEFYRQRHSKVQLSPLFEESETPFASFYIRPEINAKTPGTKDEMQQISSLSEMFASGNRQTREIYLTADAGLGKTTFSKYLATSWCDANCPDEKERKTYEKKDEEKKDVDCLSKYEFVFLVLLRDSKDLCSVDDLIFKLIVSTLAHSEIFDKKFLQEILNREKCLIILDGLDEWTHPENSEKPCHLKPVSIPHRNDHKACTFLTTTRPWKMGGLNLSSNALGKQVILTKLSESSTRTLTTRTIQRLKSLPDEKSSKKDAGKLIDEIDDSNNAELAFVPLLLMYIICLWCDGVKIAKSKCELYVNVVELLLSRTVTKYGELQMTGDSFDGDIPECFTEHEYCTKYFSLLVSLGKLAYKTLSDEKRENTLVFDRKVADKYLSKQYITFCLHSGILTESTSKTFTKKISKVSFSHKTVQEFFAALFISSQSDGQKQVLEKCTNVQSILDMSKICEFLSKMNSKMMCEISACLMSVINEDEETRKYRTPGRYMFYLDEPLYNIQEMFVSCLKQMPESENIKLCLQDFVIFGDTIHDEHLQRLSKQNQTNMKSLYIDIEGTNSSFGDVIKLFSLTDSSNLQTLCYYGDWDKKEEAELSLLLSENLQHVQLRRAVWTNYEGKLCERITALKHVQYLDIGSVKLCHEIQSILYDFISNNKTIKQLELENLDCKEHDAYHDCTGNFDLSIKHSQLEKLVLGFLPPLNITVTSQSLVDVGLWYINLGESSLLLSRDMINIKHVVLGDIEISAERFRDFINVVEKLPQSVTVMMDGCYIEPETEYERVRNYIRSSQKFDVTHDRKDKDGDQVFEFQTTTSCDM